MAQIHFLNNNKNLGVFPGTWTDEIVWSDWQTAVLLYNPYIYFHIFKFPSSLPVANTPLAMLGACATQRTKQSEWLKRQRPYRLDHDPAKSGGFPSLSNKWIPNYIFPSLDPLVTIGATQIWGCRGCKLCGVDLHPILLVTKPLLQSLKARCTHLAPPLSKPIWQTHAAHLAWPPTVVFNLPANTSNAMLPQLHITTEK